ncbi:hypothetical protein E1262_20440 [Jiangella aurantiaca]|uniref:Bacterial transcriptional activator domain-containing protein n=1 Tax=Jiangella aurantiaca TaxID=2530373 RepID=A0A4R5A8J5_9ACTN|nr:hypothetical protein [Jiangella aurantiaca]TDD66994.1 hypothetical protein E1262_20440 [Jiangella aurantiaca]
MIASSTPRAVMRGLAALLGLAALVAGVPAVLWAAGGSPLPGEWPSPADIRAAAVRPDDGSLFLALLIVAGWLGWGTFVLSLVVEVPAALRGRPAPRLPGLGAPQRMVAGLVAAVAAVGAGGQVAAAPSTSLEPWEPAPPVTTDLLTAHQRAGMHVVVDGDTLWEIAGARLDDPLRYPEIVAASSATVQPDGRRLTDPDLIVPGWTLTLPGADDAVSGLPDTGGPPADSAGMVTSQDDVASGSAGGASDSVGGAPDSEGADGLPEPGIDDGELLRTAGGVGAVLAAALVGVLAGRRAREQRRRGPGDRLGAVSASDQRTETELRQAADPVAVEVVDRVLRGLAARLARAGRGLPPLRAVRLTRRTLELYLAAPAELPPPFAGTAHGGVWTVSLDEAIDDDPGVPAPYPSLVTLGHDHDDALVLLDLEQVGTLVVDGPPELVRSALTAVAAELATSAWADDLRVTLVGAPALADLDLLDTGRVRHVTDVEQLLDELTVRVADDRLLLATAGVSGLGAARATQVADAAWTPEIVVIAEPLPTAQWARLEALIVTAPRVAVAAVVGSGDPNGLPSRGHRLRGRVSHSGGGTWVLRLDGPPERPVAVLDPLGVPIRPQLLDDETRGRFLGLLRATATDERPDAAAAGASTRRGSAPSGAARRQAADGSSAEARVANHRAAGRASSGGESGREVSGRSSAGVRGPERVLPRLLMLGTVEVQNAAELGEQTKLGQLTELAMFIALNPGCDSTAIDEAIWPGSAVTKTTRGTAISKLRRWLGTDSTGSSLLPRSDSGYTLRPGVRSDWDDWCDLLPDGPARATTADLRAALELVRGRPFSGRGRRRYAWADHLAQEMIASIVDASHELALRALVDGDPWEALRAALVGLSVEPGVELLWRDRLKAEAVLGDRDRLLDTIEKLRATAADLGGDLEAETEELIEQLRSGRGTAAAESGVRDDDGGAPAGRAGTAGRGTTERPAGPHGSGRSRSPAGR